MRVGTTSWIMGCSLRSRAGLSLQWEPIVLQQSLEVSLSVKDSLEYSARCQQFHCVMLQMFHLNDC